MFHFFSCVDSALLHLKHIVQLKIENISSHLRIHITNILTQNIFLLWFIDFFPHISLKKTKKNRKIGFSMALSLFASCIWSN